MICAETWPCDTRSPFNAELSNPLIFWLVSSNCQLTMLILLVAAKWESACSCTTCKRDSNMASLHCDCFVLHTLCIKEAARICAKRKCDEPWTTGVSARRHRIPARCSVIWRWPLELGSPTSLATNGNSAATEATTSLHSVML